jgi:hypothetical protein
LPTDTPLDNEQFLTPTALAPVVLTAQQQLQLATALGMTVAQLFGVDNVGRNGFLNETATAVSVPDTTGLLS